MAHRKTEAANAVRNIAARAGATVVSINPTNGSHQVALLELYGKRRKFFFASTPSDRRANKNNACGVRKLLRTMV
jgi:hypothetical protein